MATQRFHPYAFLLGMVTAGVSCSGGDAPNPRMGSSNGPAFGSGTPGTAGSTDGSEKTDGNSPIKTGPAAGLGNAGTRLGNAGSIGSVGTGNDGNQFDHNGNGGAIVNVSHGIGNDNGLGGLDNPGFPLDDGIGAVAETYDVGNTPTHDTGGIGGTLDTGMGGSLDTGIGGTIDTGAGGTIDTCIPSCTPDLLGVGEKAANLVVFENATASGCDTEGRMWVGGNAKLDGYGVGAQLDECDPKDPVLVVGGDLEANGGVNGRIWVGGQYTGSHPKCGTIASDKPAPVDFAFVEKQLTAYSKLLASYPVNGKTTDNFGSTVFKGTDRNMNIFTVTGEQVAASNGFTIDVPATSTAIINVTGAATSFSGGTMTLPDKVTCGSGAVKLNDFCNQLVWNMPAVKTITISGTAVQGTILAPSATLTGGGANVNGTVIVNKFNTDGCVEMHPHYFNGCLCTKAVDSVYACCPR